MKLIFTLKDLVKYIIFIGVVYTILKLIPSQKLYQKDLFLIVIVIVSVFLLVDYFNKKETFENIDKPQLVKVLADPDDPNEDEATVYSYSDDVDYNYKEDDKKDSDSDEKYDNEVKDITYMHVQDFLNEQQVKPTKPVGKTKPVKTKPSKKITSQNSIAVGNKSQNNISDNSSVRTSTSDGGVTGPAAAAGTSVSDLANSIADIASSIAKKSSDETEDVVDTLDEKNGINQELLIEKTIIEEKILSPNQKNNVSDNLLPSNTIVSEKLSCDTEMEKLRKTVESTINQLENKVLELEKKSANENLEKYMDLLIKDLVDDNVLDDDDVFNIRSKIDSKVLTVEEMTKHLEKLKLNSKNKPRKNSNKDNKNNKNKDKDYDNIYTLNELPPDFYKPLGSKELSSWDNQYTILNTDKWKVPMPSPPVCINNSPCNVCPTDEPQGYYGYPLSLKEWDSARKFTNMPLKKGTTGKIKMAEENVVTTKPHSQNEVNPKPHSQNEVHPKPHLQNNTLKTTITKKHLIPVKNFKIPKSSPKSTPPSSPKSNKKSLTQPASTQSASNQSESTQSASTQAPSQLPTQNESSRQEGRNIKFDKPNEINSDENLVEDVNMQENLSDDDLKILGPEFKENFFNLFNN